MQNIDKITVAMTTFDPVRLFPTDEHYEHSRDSEFKPLTETYLSGWIRSIERLKMVDDILIIEKSDGEYILPAALEEPYRILTAPNNPPYADPFRQQMLDAAKNDWVLVLDDDERLSCQMIAFLESLVTRDPVPTKPWAAIRFPRQDYIFHDGLWKYVPANGSDHQMRLVDRRQVRWPGKPHSMPQVDGAILTVSQPECAILHYRDFNKIVSWTRDCNERFADMPEIVAMQDAYVQRVKEMLGDDLVRQ